MQVRKEGKDYRILPRKLQETRGTWCLTGWEPLSLDAGDAPVLSGSEIRWLADEWQEMKLIVPGINDTH
ncbi:hypothetical protein LJK87_16520 [Paenibacillus sp. P25]|nr:hypothetical protein LJK87_16520 [Paenibacillus sp. P25]